MILTELSRDVSIDRDFAQLSTIDGGIESDVDQPSTSTLLSHPLPQFPHPTSVFTVSKRLPQMGIGSGHVTTINFADEITLADDQLIEVRLHFIRLDFAQEQSSYQSSARASRGAFGSELYDIEEIEELEDRFILAQCTQPQVLAHGGAHYDAVGVHFRYEFPLTNQLL